MRIALMTNNYKPFVAGVPVSIERLAKGLAAAGHEVTVFAPAYSEELFPGDQASGEGIRIVRYHTFTQRFIGGVVLPNPFDARIEEEFRENRYDVIHVHHPMLIGRAAVYISRKYKIPLVFTYHTRYEQYLCYIRGIRVLETGAAKKGALACTERKLLSLIREKLVPLWLKSFLKHCSAVCAPTAGMKEYLTEICGYDEEKIVILPTGIEEKMFHVKEEEVKYVRNTYAAAEIPLFVSVSRLAHEKNVEFLLKSVCRFKEQYGKPFRLLLIGEGPEEKEYKKLCEKLGLTEEVIFAGKVENHKIAPFYSAADAFLFASKTETQGIVILESFAGETPVVAVDASGVRDIVEDGQNGFLCPEDEICFAEKMLALTADETLRKRLSNGAQKTAYNFRQEAVAGCAVQLYNSVIAQYEAKGEGRPLHPRILAD